MIRVDVQREGRQWVVLVREPGKSTTVYRHISRRGAGSHAADIRAMNEVPA